MHNKFEDLKLFGSGAVLQQTTRVGNNTRYIVRCDCGEIFTTYAQQLVTGQIDRCKKCRKRERRPELKRLKAIGNIRCDATKYTLMDTEKTHIIKGSLGIHSYFDKSKAEIAARVLGDAVVVPLEEAQAISG